MKHKIYIVDDTPTNLQVLADYLIERGYEVFVAIDGTNAIEQITQSLPDLVLLDVMMPGIDGFETCQRLKSLPSTKDIPVIFYDGIIGNHRQSQRVCSRRSGLCDKTDPA